MEKEKILKKVYIIGPEGSGKTTLAELLSKKLKIKHYGLDDVVWTRKYDRKRTNKNRLKKLNTIISKKKWIVEGIFGGWTESIFKRADLVIMLNLEHRILTKNLIKRAIFHRHKNEREKVRMDHVIKVIKHVKKYRTRDHIKSRKGHMRLIKKHKVNLIEIKHQKELRKFIKNLK